MSAPKNIVLKSFDPSFDPKAKSSDGETFEVEESVALESQLQSQLESQIIKFGALETEDKASEDDLKALDSDYQSTLFDPILPPPEKKQNLNEEENKAKKKTIDPQIDHIDGFNIDEYPHLWSRFLILPWCSLSENPELQKRVKGYAESALNQFNAKESTNWVIDEVLKVNGGGCGDYHWYITCSVKTSKGEKNFFQVETVQNIGTREEEFPIIRLKAEKDNGIKCLKSAPGPSSLELSGDESGVSVPIDLPPSPTKSKMACPFTTDLFAEAGSRWAEKWLRTHGPDTWTEN